MSGNVDRTMLVFDLKDMPVGGCSPECTVIKDFLQDMRENWRRYKLAELLSNLPLGTTLEDLELLLSENYDLLNDEAQRVLRILNRIDS